MPAQSAASAVSSTDSSAAGEAQPYGQQGQEIVVTGQLQLFHDVRPEAQLDQQAIESYGVSTVSDLIDEVEGDLADDQEPLILVNGERVDDISEIGGFPVEALRNVQVLPRGSAVRVGGTSGQRVISLALQRKMRAATITVAPKIATDGDWHGLRGESLLTYIQGPTRANLTFRARSESSLQESERGVIEPDQFVPFALEGNVVGFPDLTGEIDPDLSALAGEPVFVAPLPQTSSPTLSDFIISPNQANVTDIGRFRTLRPDLRDYELSGTASTRLAPWLTANATFRLDRSISHSLRGLPSQIFVLSSTNPASPFSTDVGLAFYGATPLRSRSRTDNGSGSLGFSGKLGRWNSTLNLSHSELTNIFDTERTTSFGMVSLADSIDPFDSDLSPLIGITTDRSRSRTLTNLAKIIFNGPALNLPAGPVQTTIEGRLSWYRLRSNSTFFDAGNRTFRRNEQGFRAAIDAPLTSRSSNVVPQIGDLDATAEFGRVHFSDAGTLDYHSLGLTWEPADLLRLRGSIEETQNPPSLQILGNPVVETPDVRVFDPLTGRTVDVVEISGGNPDVRPERVKVHRLTALFRLLPRLNLQANAEYTDTDSRNFISSLPPASLAVMLAFPERYVRDANGNLTRVDLRPVNFDSHQEKRLRWGLSMRAKLARGNILGSAAADSAPPDSSGGEGPPETAVRQGRTPSTYLELSANHTIVFSDKLLIRPALDNVDLLGGGALGIGGGRVRHQVDGTAAITSGGLGARVGVTWRGASTLDTSINSINDTVHFSPLLLINLRLFADANRFFPGSQWARGLRFSVDVVNAANDRQRVRDSFGHTPLQYQPAYRDPLGRTIELEIRKVF